MTRYDCEHCEATTESRNEMRIHILLNHPDEADPDDYTTEVSSGYLDGEPQFDTGEQFGYK